MFFSPAAVLVFLCFLTLGLQVPSKKVFRVGLEGPVIPSEEVLGALGLVRCVLFSGYFCIQDVDEEGHSASFPHLQGLGLRLWCVGCDSAWA